MPKHAHIRLFSIVLLLVIVFFATAAVRPAAAQEISLPSSGSTDESALEAAQPEPPAKPAEVAGDLSQADRVRLTEWYFWQSHGDVPVELLLAMASRESGRTFDNTVNADGIMQVTPESGADMHRPYNNTYGSVEENLVDAVALYNHYLDSVRSGGDSSTRMTQMDGTQVDTTGFLADLPYADYIRAALRYNAGNNPALLYNRGAGDPGYLGHLADELENGSVAAVVGSRYSMDSQTTRDLVQALRMAQDRVTYQISHYYQMYAAW